ncbi:MAG: hypothetical protein ACR2OW_07385 [Methyloligellaceae bacterium]
MRILQVMALVSGLLVSTVVAAGEVEIVEVKVTAQSGQKFRFDVTLKHADEGWKHYANRWQVETLDGKNLGTRVLYHPHVNEQPFTRSLAGVIIPDDISRVKIRAFDSVHGDKGLQFEVDVPR